MKLRELTSQRESDAHSALLAPLGGLGLMEALEDPLLLIACNAGTGIGHFDRRSGRVVEYADLNPTPSGCEFHRVSNEIREDDLDAVRVAEPFSGLAIRVENQLDVLRPRGRRRILCDARAKLAGSTCMILRRSPPDSSRARSSRSSIIRNNRVAFRRTTFSASRSALGCSFSSSASTGDKINVSGVRNS